MKKFVVQIDFQYFYIMLVSMFLVYQQFLPQHVLKKKKVKVAAGKRATHARSLRTRKPSSDPDLNEFSKQLAEHAGDQAAQKKGS